MSRNGKPQLKELDEMEDNELQVIAVRCFHLLSERWNQDITEVIWDCYSQVNEDVDEEAELR